MKCKIKDIILICKGIQKQKNLAKAKYEYLKIIKRFKNCENNIFKLISKFYLDKKFINKKT